MAPKAPRQAHRGIDRFGVRPQGIRRLHRLGVTHDGAIINQDRRDRDRDRHKDAELRRLIEELARAILDAAAELHRSRHAVPIGMRASLSMLLARRVARCDLSGLSVKRDVSAYDHLLSVN
jgi:hypothetical protein